MTPGFALNKTSDKRAWEISIRTEGILEQGGDMRLASVWFSQQEGTLCFLWSPLIG